MHRFAFGKNWQRFIDEGLTEDHIGKAISSMADFLGSSSLEGKTFLDVGCGSGLSSLCALRLGAKRVVSFDIDADSIKCAETLRASTDYHRRWEIVQGSILDKEFLEGLGTFDVVYAWGVLHHTGSMWAALKNAISMTEESGIVYVAIYNKARAFGIYPDGRIGPSSLWLTPKRIYSGLPRMAQDAIAGAVMFVFCLNCLLRFRNPWKAIAHHRNLRGMSLFTDVRDWLGGWPYEFASVDEVYRFVVSERFQLENLKFHGGLMCNEYLFRRTDQDFPLFPAQDS